MQLRKFLKTYKGLIETIGLILFVIVGFTVGVIPGFKSISAIRSDITTLSNQTKQLQTKLDVLNSVDEEAYAGYLAQLVTAVPQDQSITTLFATLDGVGNETGTSVIDVALAKPGAIASDSARKQSKEEQEIGSNLLPFSATITGDYDQIRNFLAQTVSVRRFFRIRSFDLQLLDPGHMAVRMAMDAFYAPYLTLIGAVDKPVEPLSQKDEQTIRAVEQMPRVGVAALNPLDTGSSVPTTENKANPFAP